MNRSFVFGVIMFALTSSSLIADPILLDQVMTREEQRKTGVVNLSMQQKIALESWLNKNFVLKQKQPEQPAAAQLTLSINIDQGQKLQLSDNSVWEIAPSDVPQAAVWITPFPVKIVDSNDPDYPVLLVNMNSGISVRARKYVAAPVVPPTPMAPSPPPTRNTGKT